MHGGFDRRESMRPLIAFRLVLVRTLQCLTAEGGASELSGTFSCTSTYLGAEHSWLARSTSQACSVIDLHLHRVNVRGLQALCSHGTF